MQERNRDVLQRLMKNGIAVEGSLEQDIRVLDDIRFVMKGGKVYVDSSAGP